MLYKSDTLRSSNVKKLLELKGVAVRTEGCGKESNDSKNNAEIWYEGPKRRDRHYTTDVVNRFSS